MPILKSFLSDTMKWIETMKAESHRRNADNHVGWEVQVLPEGKPWSMVGTIKETKEAAMRCLLEYKKFWPQYEYRVYESVKEKK